MKPNKDKMTIAYKSRYMCGTCYKYHKNGSKPQQKCEMIEEVKRKLLNLPLSEISNIRDIIDGN